MKVISLDNQVSNWLLSHTLVHQNKSELHLKARQLLHELFPTLSILEEVCVNIRKNQIVYLDFFLPLKRMCIEVNGEQHTKFIPHFHGSITGFFHAQKKDNDKKEWCRINNINLIELLYSETLDEWKNKLI